MPIRHEGVRIIIGRFLKRAFRLSIPSAHQQRIRLHGRFVVLLFSPLGRVRHDLFIHQRIRGRILFPQQILKLAQITVILRAEPEDCSFQIAVEDFIRQCGNAGLYVLKEQNFIVNGGRLLVALVRFIRERGIVLDIHSRFLEIAHRGQALDRGIVIAAVARLQATRVHNVLAAVLVIVQRFKGRDRCIVVSGFHVRGSLIVDALHPRLLGFVGKRGVRRDVYSGLLKSVQCFKRLDGSFVIAAVARL